MIQPAPGTNTSAQAWVAPAPTTHRGVQVTRDDPGAKAKTARGLREEHREVAARPPATVERGERRLRALFVAALVEERVGDAGAEVLEQRQRVGGGPRTKPRAQAWRRPSGSGYCSAVKAPRSVQSVSE